MVLQGYSADAKLRVDENGSRGFMGRRERGKVWGWETGQSRMRNGGTRDPSDPVEFLAVQQGVPGGVAPEGQGEAPDVGGAEPAMPLGIHYDSGSVPGTLMGTLDLFERDEERERWRLKNGGKSTRQPLLEVPGLDTEGGGSVFKLRALDKSSDALVEAIDGGSVSVATSDGDGGLNLHRLIIDQSFWGLSSLVNSCTRPVGRGGPERHANTHRRSKSSGVCYVVGRLV